MNRRLFGNGNRDSPRMSRQRDRSRDQARGQNHNDSRQQHITFGSNHEFLPKV